MSTEFDARVILVVKELAENLSNQAGRGYWKKLEDASGIKAKVWSNICDRRQRATVDVIAAIGKLRPEYAFWLATGITDAVNGHVAPTAATTFPERASVSNLPSDHYFMQAISLKDRLLKEAGLGDDIEKLLVALERKPVFGHVYWDGLISDTAYRLSGQSEYAQLRKLWQIRESTRSDHKKWLLQETEEPDENAQTVKDPRSAHQSQSYMFYEPKVDDNKKD